MSDDAPIATQEGVYRSVTRQVRAVVRFESSGELEGQLHLQPSTRHPDGFETPLEFLNRAEPFFAVALDDGRVALLSKAQAAVIECVRYDVPSDPVDAMPTAEAELEVELADGSTRRGHAVWHLPPAHRRLQDFLNSAEGFFEIEHGDMLSYINRSHIRAVRPLD